MQTLDQVLKRHPSHHIAVIDQEKKITYAELAALSDACARSLIQLYDVRPNTRVAVKLIKSWEAVVVLLGILKTRASYVIIDPKLSKAAQENIVKTSNANLILEELDIVENLNIKLPKVKINDECYSYFTSGSTGTPKVTCFDHQRAMCFLDWAQDYFQFKTEEKIACVSPLTFDVCILDIFVTLYAGATVVIVPDSIKLFRKSFIEYLNAYKVATIQLVPTLWEFIAESSLPYLKKIIFTGQALNLKQFKMLENQPQVECYNLYGQTEANSYLSYKFTFNESEYPVAIANLPLPNYIEIRDNVLWIKKHTLMKNFLGQEEIQEYCTGDVVNIKDGKLFLSGRIDNLIKCKGYRVSPEEIEAILNKVVEVSIVFHEALQDELVAVIKTDIEDYENILKNYCKQHLEIHQMPSKFIKVDEIAKNYNGKLDRKKTIELFSS